MSSATPAICGSCGVHVYPDFRVMTEGTHRLTLLDDDRTHWVLTESGETVHLCVTAPATPAGPGTPSRYSPPQPSPAASTAQ